MTNEKENDDTPIYLGIDLETTGLDPTRDRIIEIAVVVLTADLRVPHSDDIFWTRFGALVRTPQQAIESGGAKDFHIKTGLLVPRSSDGVVIQTGDHHLNLSCIEEDLIQLFCEQFPKPPILLGHSVHFDRGFIKHWMSHFHDRLSHRNLDARTVELLWPDLPWPEPATHRAMADIERSISVLRMAREMLGRRDR